MQVPQKKSKFSETYAAKAQAVLGKPKLYLLEGTSAVKPARQEDATALLRTFDDLCLEKARINLERVERGEPMIKAHTWQATRWEQVGKARFFTITLPDQEEALWTRAWIDTLLFAKEEDGTGGHRLRAVEREELPILHKYSGLLQSEGLKDKKKDFFNVLIKSFMMCRGLLGEIVATTPFVTRTGVILEILLDDEAVESLGAVDYQIPLGSAGVAHFRPVRPQEGTAQRELAAAEARVAEVEGELQARQQVLEEIRARQATESVVAITTGMKNIANVSNDDESEAPAMEGEVTEGDGGQCTPEPKADLLAGGGGGDGVGEKPKLY